MAPAPHTTRFRPALEQLESRLVPAAPTVYEQLLLEQLNDARASPAAYGASIGLDLSAVAPAQPLAFDPRLIDAARFHSQDMNDHGYFAHTAPNGTDPGDRMTAFGYPWRSYGESIAAGFATPAEALRGLIIDAGVPDLGHRRHLLAMDSTFRGQGQVGVGIVLNGSGPYGDYYTIDTAQTVDTRPFLTGVVYTDANRNGRYDVGEGLGGVSVTVAGIGSTVTFASGGYSLQLNPGSYTVTLSGPGLPAPVSRAVALGSQNVRLNVTPATASNAPSAADLAWVAQEYRDLLHRPASQAEATAWATALQQGLPRTTADALIRGSAEFVTNNTLWVRNLYRDLLHREAGAAEVSTWVAGLGGGMAPQTAVAYILGSLEYLQPQWNGWVTLAYQDLLNRSPGAGELATWTGALRGGLTREALVASIAGSPEFARRLLTNTDASWVRLVYNEFLRRSATSGEVTSWVGILQGSSRTAVALMIAQSPEYRRVQGAPLVRSLYESLLWRTPSSAEVNLWAGQLAGGMTPEALVVTFLTTDEYYARVLRTP